MNLQEYWLPYTVTHAITFFLIFICYKWPKIGKVAWGIIFILAGIFNIYTGISEPQAYVDYGSSAIGLYKKFIYGVFSSYTSLIVSLIALGQILVGVFLFMKRTLFFLGILGGIVFLLAISPLGIGSAFPSTLLMAISLVLLYIRNKKA
ncbi:MAG: hypothetical protein GTO17_04545 [Candidatus Aminicenantes bacterium]|nr:hypothetical protein [Candidatus Aminicenantes bacterium]